MSDEPKTCGTCFYGMPRRYGAWFGNDLICLRHAVSTRSDRAWSTACGTGPEGPRWWMPKDEYFWRNSGKIAPIDTFYLYDEYTEETDEIPSCSLCGSLNVAAFCADCGVRIDYLGDASDCGKEAEHDATS